MSCPSIAEKGNSAVDPRRVGEASTSEYVFGSSSEGGWPAQCGCHPHGPVSLSFRRPPSFIGNTKSQSPPPPASHPTAGILMILPQSSAYRTLSDRLSTVSTHHQSSPAASLPPSASRANGALTGPAQVRRWCFNPIIGSGE
jgi:hypothetical protein